MTSATTPDKTERSTRPAPRVKGDRNQNPSGLGFLALVAEDFRTHDRSLLEPGFWAVAVHRFGNWRMGVRWRVFRAPLTLLYTFLNTGVNWIFGIDLGYTVNLGRRIRIWHHGGMVLGAESIGDDVHLRHNTTLGLASRHRLGEQPTIGNRVDIGSGACILGAVTIGDGCVIGANSVVTKNMPPDHTAFGVPARIFKLTEA